jgi:NAD+ synthase
MRDNALTLALGQLNPLVNDIDGNFELARRFLEDNHDADLCVLPECFVTGYPFEDLAFRPGFVERAGLALERLREIVRGIGGPGLLVGVPVAGPDRPFNAAALLHPDGHLQVATKVDLPNIGVFDEWRHFTPGAPRAPFAFRGARIGVAICEEMWHGPVVRHLADEGMDFLVVINGSPFEQGKDRIRIDHARNRVRAAGCPLVYLNQVGGQDELVFDGASFALDAQGEVVARARAFREDTLRLVLRRAGPETGDVRIERLSGGAGEDEPQGYPDLAEATYRALVLGTRDYVRKNGFPGVVIGLSGGFDSAFVAAACVDALGPDAVLGVTMPSRFNSPGDVADAHETARLLGIRIEEIPIEAINASALEALAPAFAGRPRDVSEENLQARIRGLLLMALSNKLGLMLMTTGNKSEMSVGYATLYGDMSGGFNLLKDVFKSDAMGGLAPWRDALGNRPDLGFLGRPGPVIPQAVLAKPPSAGLADSQTDEAVLGPYPVLDALLRGIVEHDRSPATAAREAARELGLDPDAPVGRSPDLAAHAERVARLVQVNEYKRRQSAPGPKVSSRNLGRDRRYPITTGGRLW